jgi:hypothetical protein
MYDPTLGHFNYGQEKLSQRKLSLVVVFPVEDLAVVFSGKFTNTILYW